MARHIKGTKQIVSLSLDSAVVRRVENLADAKGVSRSGMIEDLIENAIDQEEIMVRMFRNPVLAQTLVKVFAQPKVLKALAKGMGERMTPDEMEKFYRGVQLLGNYGPEYRVGVPPELVAKRTMEKVVKSSRESKRRSKRMRGSQ